MISFENWLYFYFIERGSAIHAKRLPDVLAGFNLNLAKIWS